MCEGEPSYMVVKKDCPQNDSNMWCNCLNEIEQTDQQRMCYITLQQVQLTEIR